MLADQSKIDSSALQTASKMMEEADDDLDVSDDEDESAPDAEDQFMMESPQPHRDPLAKEIELNLPGDVGLNKPGIGQITQAGRGASFIIVDDPHNPLNAALRESIVAGSVENLFPAENSGEW